MAEGQTHVIGSRAAQLEPGKRNKEKSYIVLLGLSGAGKSTTMNTLFDRDDVDSSSGIFTSATQEVLEYKVVAHGAQNQNAPELIVVDTPGFFDVREESHEVKDAKIMATLESFLACHPDLKDCYPSAVLLIADFHDYRIYEENSYFAQFLKALERLNDNQYLIDTSSTSCNLILVLTHFLSAKEEEVKNPEPQIRFLVGLIKTFTSITSNFPVVLAENKGHVLKLPMAEGYYKLPTGDIYPYNLYRAMQSVAINSRDRVGEAVITSAFRDPLALKKEQVSTLNLLNESTPEFLNFKYILGEVTLKTPENDMTLQLDQLWKQLGNQMTYGNRVFLQVMKSVFLREGINSEDDIPDTPAETLAILRQLPATTAIEQLVRKVGIVAPPLWESCKTIGSFYNVETESVSNNSPFVNTGSRITLSGYEAPSYLQVEFVSNLAAKNVLIIKKHSTLEACVAKFWESRGVAFIKDREKDSMINIPEGHNLQSEKYQISGIYEFRQYSIFLRKFYKLNPRYVQEVSNMNKKSRTEWKNHFEKYGSHVVESGYLGGYVKVIGKKKENVSNPASIEVAYKTIEEILLHLGRSAKFDKHETTSGWSFELLYYGGDNSVSRPTLSRVFTPAGASKFNTWYSSLEMNSVLLNSDLALQHISHFLKKDYPVLASTLSQEAKITLGVEEYLNLDEAVKRPNVGRSCVIL